MDKFKPVKQTTAPAKTTENRKLNAIEKALEIMLKFQDIKDGWGIGELSGELGFSPATVQRILSALKSYGFVRQDTRTRNKIHFSRCINLLLLTDAARPFSLALGQPVTHNKPNPHNF